MWMLILGGCLYYVPLCVVVVVAGVSSSGGGGGGLNFSPRARVHLREPLHGSSAFSPTGEAI